MSKVETMKIDLPEDLFNESKALIKEGHYSNFSELVKVSIENNLLLHLPLIKNKKRLYELFEEDKLWKDISSISQEDIIERINKIRYDKMFKKLN